MADVVLLQKGANLSFQTKKLQVAVPAPSQRFLYDQCGKVIGKKVSGSFQISGRRDCFEQVQEIQRVSYRYFFFNDPLELEALQLSLNGAGAANPPTPPFGIFVPNPPGNIFIEDRFLNNPRLPLEREIKGYNGPLTDACGVTYGTVESKSVQLYGYVAATCQAYSRYGYSTTIARHSSITDGFALSNIDVLSGYNLLQQTAETPAISNLDAMRTAWAALAGQNITLAVGAFE